MSIQVSKPLELAGNSSAEFHRYLSTRLGASPRLIPTPLQDAELPDYFADVVLSISALEHFSESDLQAVFDQIPRVLKPGGIIVLTTDLFLDVSPFTESTSNCWGRNIDLCNWLASAGLETVVGNRAELNGFPEFDPRAILAKLATYNVGVNYPCLAQCLVARRLR